MSENLNIKSPKQQTLMRKLKTNTKSWHIKLESLPFFKDLRQHTLPLENYVQQLRSLAVIHSVFENEIAASKDKFVTTVWSNKLRKLPFLQKDIDFFRPRFNTDYDTVTEAAQEIVKKIRFRQVDNPVTLLGYLYVYEGSTLGNNMHKPDIVSMYQLKDLNGCCFYASYQDRVKESWQDFSQKMNSVLQDHSGHKEIIDAAIEAFSDLEFLYKKLHPLQKSALSGHITKINPEAGNHPVPHDEKEIEAALAASDEVWAQYSYYEQRFGERGKRFSDSDMCWLVTLTDLDQQTVQEQVDWLADVLANRGMPCLMLEETLRILHKTLIKTLPGNKAKYDKLHIASEQMKKNRQDTIPQKDFENFVTDFDKDVPPALKEKHKNAGKLIVAALCDQKAGLNGPLNIILPWMTDEKRFPQSWIGQVNKTVDAVQKFRG